MQFYISAWNEFSQDSSISRKLLLGEIETITNYYLYKIVVSNYVTNMNPR